RAKDRVYPRRRRRGLLSRRESLTTWELQAPLLRQTSLRSAAPASRQGCAGCEAVAPVSRRNRALAEPGAARPEGSPHIVMFVADGQLTGCSRLVSMSQAE